MEKKTFFTHNLLAVIGLLFCVLTGPLFGYIFYSIIFKRVIRLVRFSHGSLIVPQDWSIAPYQCGFKADIALIQSIEFSHVLENSKGEHIVRTYYLMPCLNISFKDGGAERVMMFGFTKNQFRSIEKFLLNANPSIEVGTTAEEYIRKYGNYY